MNLLDSPENSVTLQLASSSKAYVLSFDILFKSSGSVTIKVEVDDTKTYTIVYDTGESVMEIKEATVTYGIGPTRGWRRITRNLSTDFNKAFGERGRKKHKKEKPKLHITELQSLTLQGLGCIGKEVRSASFSSALISNGPVFQSAGFI